MFKNINGMSQEINNDIIVQGTENHHNLSHQNDFLLPHIRTAYHGNKSLSYLGPKVLGVAVDKFKQINSFISFKVSIKNWAPLNYPSRLSKTYISGVGFI